MLFFGGTTLLPLDANFLVCFFLGTKENKPRPLIYDSKLQKIHMALIKDDPGLNEFFEIKGFQVNDFGVFCSVNKTPLDLYKDYLSRIGEIAEKCSDIKILNECPSQGIEGQIEYVLFSKEIQKIAKDHINSKS